MTFKLWTPSVFTGLRSDNVSLCWRVCVHTSLHLLARSHSHSGIYSCMWTVRLSCLQVCTAAAASLCVPLIKISIAGGTLMARTCVSHYCKLQILLSESRMFHSHFVISSMRKKPSAICDSRKTAGRILKAILTDQWNHQEILMWRHKGDGCSFL